MQIIRPEPRVHEISYAQRNIRKMEAANSKIILERLKEDWVQVADASMYRELELEKQLWMLAALRSLKTSSDVSIGQTTLQPGGAKSLSLYENHGKFNYSSG